MVQIASRSELLVRRRRNRFIALLLELLSRAVLLLGDIVWELRESLITMASASLHNDSKKSAQHADIKKSLTIASLSLYIAALSCRRHERRTNNNDGNGRHHCLACWGRCWAESSLEKLFWARFQVMPQTGTFQLPTYRTLNTKHSRYFLLALKKSSALECQHLLKHGLYIRWWQYISFNVYGLWQQLGLIHHHSVSNNTPPPPRLRHHGAT